MIYATTRYYEVQGILQGCIVMPVPGVFLVSVPNVLIFFYSLLFERSEFLIATCKKKKTDRLCVCGCSANLLVLVIGRQIVYGQNTVYLCLSKYIVFENTQQYKNHVVRSIARSGVSPPGARSDGHHWCQAARTAATCT